MNRYSEILSLCLLFLAAYSYAQDEPLFTIDPCLTPDASNIIFSYDGDLWKSPVEGGQAYRLTAMDGDETRPLVSPDGKWIAFSGTQYGNRDIYIMPYEGGEIRQLTYHDSFDDVDSWSWDSKTIYFTSGRYNRYAGYSVSIDGTTPKRLFDHYFNTVHNIAVHPTTGNIFFNETWESKNFAHRKRYKGDYNPDIKSYNPASGNYQQHTTYRGKDFGITFDRSGNGYFMSDEANGEYNLYTFDNGQKKQLTSFTSSIYWPRVSANGEKVAFRKDYKVYIYDVATGSTMSPDIRLYKNQTLEKEEAYDISGNISYFDVSPDNKKMAFTSRGRMFVSDIKGKFIKEIKTTSTEAVGEVLWLKDNRTLLYSQSLNGYYNWYTIKADGSDSARQLTSDTQNNRQLTMNSDRSQAVYLSGRNEVRLMDLEDLTSKTIANDELWALYNPAPSFSPDDRYVMFNAYRDFEQDIMIYDTESDTAMNLTNTKVSESNPVWSPDGKYIYFTSDLLNPSYPYGTRNAHLYRVMLDKYEDPFKIEEVAKLFEEEEEDNDEEKEDEESEEEDSSTDEDVKEEEEEEDKMTVTINMDGIMERIERIGPAFGQQAAPYIIQKDEETIVLYLSNHDEGENHLWKTTIKPFENNKTEKISKERMFGYGITSIKNKHYILTGGDISTLNPSSGKMEKLKMSHSFRKNLADEFQQMFYEAWGGVEENFYNETFHGQDWEALRDKYAQYLKGVTNRAELRLIFNDMLGELNTSHFGFYSNGKEENIYHGSQTMGTGILFDNNNPYVVSRILKDSPADVKDKDIQSGDRLVAVNGIEVDPSMNREKYFTVPKRDQELTLTFARNGEHHDVILHTVQSFMISSLLYDEWQDSNQEYVDQKTNKRIAYIHMKNMGGGELNKFKRDIITEAGYRDGIILDLRFNTGGNVHDDVLRLLSQRAYLQWKYREGKLTNQSNFAPADKPIVLLINEQSLSDAEMTAAGFKQLGLGTIVGTETYRWIIFTSGKGLVDGSFYRLPSWGCYTLDGDNLEKTGVAPDTRVDKNFKDRLDGNHPQLDKAIELIMAELK